MGNLRRSSRIAALAVLVAACGGEPDSRHPGVMAVWPSPPSALTVCAAGPTVPGVDVSHYDGAIDWSQVKASGQAFGIAKATEGLTFTDPMFAANWPAMKEAGLVRGAYHFFRPLDDGAAQADFFLSRVVAFGAGDLPPILDWEVNDTTITDALQVQRAQDFVDEIKAATGLSTIVYTSARFLSLVGNPPQFAGLPLWDARYGVTCPNIPDAWATWTFWQYDDNGTVPGIAVDAGVDVNVFNGSADDLLAMTRPPPAVDAGSDDAGGAVADAAVGDAAVADAAVADAAVPDGGAGEPPPLATSAVGCSTQSAGGTALTVLLLLAALAKVRRAR